ncbi:MAG TPA: hypothetical protein VKB46_15390 [Pyrinomonadaceae bacterium]|nr:hypothetical protein [Pyrinomonadaceae bacterium]
MKLSALILLFFVSAASVHTQEIEPWERVHTFEDSIVDLNTTLVTLITQDVARVRFRWTFDQPQNMSGEPRLTYKSQLEVMECNCKAKRYRPYHLTFLDTSGNIVRLQTKFTPADWRTPDGLTAKLFAAGCDLIERKTHPPVKVNDAELEKVEAYAVAFSQNLERSKDIKPVIQRFFTENYLAGYLSDQETNWFLNLNRDTAEKASRTELHRFYVAQLNAGYLSSLYLISQHHEDDTTSEPVIPPDIYKFIDQHPYTLNYRRQPGNYDFLAENVDSIERLRSYTTLLEGVGALMRKHVARVRAENSHGYRDMLEEWDLYRPKQRNCASECLGLPKGSKLFVVNVPVFQLQIAEINGQLKVVSAIDYFH